MGDRTKIEWCHATWNITGGCSRVSEGCKHCYAERMAWRSNKGRYKGLVEMGPHGPRWTGKVAFFEDRLDQPLRWRKPRRIFVDGMSDLFHKDMSLDAIDKAFAVMALAYWHRFIIFTKRGERMRDYCAARFGGVFDMTISDVLHDLPVTSTEDEIQDASDWLDLGKPLPNVTLGVSVEDQATADQRIPVLLDTPAACRAISAEPLLGPLDIEPYLDGRAADPAIPARPALAWVIAGGESGPGARPMHPDWARSLRDQCQDAGVPFYFKQWGAWLATRPEDPKPAADVRCHEWNGGVCAWRVGKKAAGADLGGREWREFPAAAMLEGEGA